MFAIGIVAKAVIVLAVLFGRVALVALALLAVLVPAYLIVVGAGRVADAVGGLMHGVPAVAPAHGT